MAIKLDTITGQYHSYVEDQLLTHYQLNETIDYLSDQDRLSRVFLSGTGIACGFHISINNTSDTISITQGTGLTTDGDLIKLQKKASDVASKAVKQKLFTINFPLLQYKSYKPFLKDNGNYEHFKINPTTLLPLFELMPEKPDGIALEANEKLLTAFPDIAALKNYVVILYLENYAKEATLCNQIDCSNQGGEDVYNLRVLITTKLNATTIIEKDSLFKKYDSYSEYTLLPELGVKKVIPNFNTTQSSTQIKQLFNTIVTDTAFKNSLKSGLLTMLTKSGYSTEAIQINAGITNLFTIDGNSIPNDIHYRYDLLRDLVSTYKELKDLFIDQAVVCNPPFGSFPKHLMLGILSDTGLYKSHRHQFYKAPILDHQNRTFRNFSTLVERLVQLTQKYGVVATANTVKITPSKATGKLGEKSIPYYYNVDNTFLNSWDFNRTNIFIPKANFSYHTTNLLSSDWNQSPLKYNLDEYDFYRIEGYLNDSVDDVKTVLNTHKKLFGLDFEFQIIDIIENANDLKILMNNNTSWEHKAGVKKGGTLLLLKEGNSFITDFAVDYKIAEQDGLGCCTIIECLYPWISSLNYINNLSRSLKGTQSSVKAMPTHYTLNIRKYAINGVNLITSPVVIRIPLTEVFLRRLHVVMEKINTQFPTGLVFDFMENEKKVKIMKLEKDRFEFEIQDITQTTASPVYKYTETGITKGGKVYKTIGITCSILNAHNQEVYKKIHSNYAPINKDDDNFGGFNEDWRKWGILKNKLRKHPEIHMYKRYITTLDNFRNIPANNPRENVLDVLNAIRKAIIAVDPRLGVNKKGQNTAFYIGGDWTNGNWVNSSMAKHYLEHRNNTNDDIVLFMKLRKKLHNEVNTSKFMIHIETSLPINLSAFADVFNKYASQAEFYLQKPKEGNFIEIK